MNFKKEVNLKNLKQKLVFFLFLVFLGKLMLLGQVIPTSKIVGTITDQENQFLPGATVTIRSPALILPQMSIVTNEKGYFRFVELPGGEFEVKVEMPGMKTLVRREVIVTVGRTVILNFQMELATISEEVLVVGAAPVIDTQRSSFGESFKADLITTLPIRRSFQAVLNLAPGMYENTSDGSDVRSNKYTVDGLNTNHPSFGEVAVDIGFDSIEEVIVDTGGHKAEYGSMSGGVIQVITKSGGNTFSGELNSYYRNKSLQSDNTKGTPFEGQFVGFDFEFSPGFALGAPIKKDKIWFFSSFNMQRQNSYIQGYPAFSDQNKPVNNDYYTPFVKFTWQINPSNKIVASFMWRGDYTDHLWASMFTTLDGSLKQKIAASFDTVQWQKIFSKNFIFNLRGGYLRYTEHYYPKTLGIENVIELPSEVQTSCGEESFIVDTRYEANAVGTYFIDNWLGSHEIKVGGDYEFSQWHNWYNFYEEDRLKGKYGADWHLYKLWYFDGVPYQALFSKDINRTTQALTLGIFIQDTWSISRILTLNLGFRYNLIEGLFPKQLVPGKTDIYNYEKTEKIVNWNVLAPRFSINLDPWRDGKTVIKAGYGRYYAALNLIAISYALRGGFAYDNAMLNPDFTVKYRFGLLSPNFIFDPNVKAPFDDEINFGAEREIIPNLAFGINYVQKWDKRLLQRSDANGLDVNLLKSTGEIKWTGYHIVEGIDPLTGQHIEFYEQNPDKGDVVFYHLNIPGTTRTYRGLEFKLSKRMSNKWSMIASYVYSKGEGILNTTEDETWTTTKLYVEPNLTSFFRRGLLENQRQHYFKLLGTYIAPLGFTLSGYFQAFSGTPFTRIIRSIEAGLRLYQGTVKRNAEPRGSSKNPGNYLLDLRIEKGFGIGRGTLNLIADVFNVFNSNKTTEYGARTALDYMEPVSITAPRYFRIGVSYKF